MTTDIRPALVIPVYNHGRAFRDMLPLLAATGLPLIAVDDCSGDDTRAILKQQCESYASLTVLTHEENRGKGGAVTTGLLHAVNAGFTHALQIDADGQHAPEDIDRFLEAARRQPDTVILGRPVFDDSMPTARRIGRHLTHVLIWLETLSFDISDSMCGYRIYPLAALEPLLHLRLLGRRMDFDPEILVRLHWRGARFAELETPVTYPETGHSNFRMFEDNVLMTLMHIRLIFGMIVRIPSIIRRRRRKPPSSEASGTSHWARMAERGTYLGLKFMLMVYRVFGRGLFRPIAGAVAGYFALTSATARQASREYLDNLWSYTDGDCGLAREPDLRATFRHFAAFSEAILDKVAAWRGDITQSQIDHENLELFESRLDQGDGGIWVTSHLGNIEVCRAIGQRERKMPLTVLMHTRHAENFNRLLKDVAPESDIELMEVTEFNMATAMRLKGRVDQGRFIIIVGDRIPVGHGERTITRSFLGRPARFPVGPFLLATLLDCPAGTLFCVREGDRFRIIIGDLPRLAGVPRRDRADAIEAAAEVFSRRLESLCVRYPLQWFNFFPFWSENEGNDPPESPPAG